MTARSPYRQEGEPPVPTPGQYFSMFPGLTRGTRKPDRPAPAVLPVVPGPGGGEAEAVRAGVAPGAAPPRKRHRPAVAPGPRIAERRLDRRGEPRAVHPDAVLDLDHEPLQRAAAVDRRGA